MSFDLSRRKLFYTVNSFGGLSKCVQFVDLELQSSILGTRRDDGDAPAS